MAKKAAAPKTKKKPATKPAAPKKPELTKNATLYITRTYNSWDGDRYHLTTKPPKRTVNASIINGKLVAEADVRNQDSIHRFCGSFSKLSGMRGMERGKTYKLSIAIEEVQDASEKDEIKAVLEKALADLGTVEIKTNATE